MSSVDNIIVVVSWSHDITNLHTKQENNEYENSNHTLYPGGQRGVNSW